MTHNTINYQRIMREQGFRVTPQRQIILDAVCEGQGHTTAEEIYRRVQAKMPAVNQATVYRALDFFCNLGLVFSADVGIGQKVYEIAGQTPHHHLVCQTCHRVEQISHKLVQPFFDRIEQTNHFHIHTDHLILFGICQTCQLKTANGLDETSQAAKITSQSGANDAFARP